MNLQEVSWGQDCRAYPSNFLWKGQLGFYKTKITCPAHLNVELLSHFRNCCVHSQNYFNQLFFTAKKHLHFAKQNYASLYFPLHTQVSSPFLPERSLKTSEGILKSTVYQCTECANVPCIPSSWETTYMFTIFQII